MAGFDTPCCSWSSFSRWRLFRPAPPGVRSWMTALAYALRADESHDGSDAIEAHAGGWRAFFSVST